MSEKLTIDQLKNDIAQVKAEELPKGVQVAEEGNERIPMSAADIMKTLPQRPNDKPTFVDEEIEKAKSVVYGRIKQEFEEDRQRFEEMELYAQDLEGEGEYDKSEAPAVLLDDLSYDDTEEVDDSYFKKIRMEDQVTMTEEAVVEPEKVVEMPTMKKKETVVVEEPKRESVTIVKEKETVEESVFMSDDDFEDDDEDSLDNVRDEAEKQERIAHVRSVVKAAYEENLDKVDLSKFTISKKPVSVSNALANAKPVIRVADWVLHSSGTCISVSQLSGPEIEGLDISGSGRELYNAYLDMYKILYKHVENTNKGSLEQWLKTISFYDMQDLYFAFYRACYGRDNNILYTCPDCNETYMAKKPVEDMVKFKNDEVAAKAREIMKRGPGKTEPEYKVELHQITNDYAVAVRVPSVYDMTLAPALLPSEWREKYYDLISLCTFIDCVYRINRDAGSLEPISTNPVAQDDVKTMKNRIKAFNKIFSTFSNKEYAKLRGIISNLGVDSDDIEYYIPAETCRKCGKEIAKQPMEPLQMLFTYHQLGQAAYISGN